MERMPKACPLMKVFLCMLVFLIFSAISGDLVASLVVVVGFIIIIEIVGL